MNDAHGVDRPQNATGPAHPIVGLWVALAVVFLLLPVRLWLFLAGDAIQVPLEREALATNRELVVLTVELTALIVGLPAVGALIGRSGRRRPREQRRAGAAKGAAAGSFLVLLVTAATVAYVFRNLTFVF